MCPVGRRLYGEHSQCVSIQEFIDYAKLYFYGIFVLLRRERGRALLSPDSPERDLLRTGYYANSADISSTMVVVQLGVLVTLLSLNSKF